jgi:anti-sigma regulatory factor (Ser/Thr protein kinase)
MTTNGTREADRLRSLRDALLGEALIRVSREVGSETVAAYLLDDEGWLAAAAVLDSPLGFTVNPRVDARDERYVSAAAYQRGRAVAMDSSEVRRVVLGSPVNVQHIPFSMRAASAPITASGRRLGTLTVRWIPARDLPEGAVAALSAAADDLAVSLESLAERGATMRAPAVPVFVQAGRGVLTAVIDPGGAEDAGPSTPRHGHSSSTFVFQLQKLGSGLTGATRVADVIAVAQAEIVRPFGARGVAFCLTEGERLRVVGSAGGSRDDVRALDGIEIGDRRPESDAVRMVTPLFFPSERDLHAAYPGLDRYRDGRARTFLPLVSRGRVAGCCVLTSDEPLELRDEQLALLMIMLGLVGQSLERTRAYEVERATAQGMRRALLPRGLPQVRAVDMAARYASHASPARLGNDWYDVLELPGDQIAVIIGSVRGGEADAIGVMGQLRAGVRAYATEGHDPASILTRSNRLLAESESGLPASCCCVRLDLRSGVVTCANAGHAPALFTDAHGAVHAAAELPQGPPLGTARGTVYRQGDLVIPPGGIVALYTEAGAAADTGQTARRVRGGVVGHADESLELLADRIVAGARDERRGADEITLLLLRYEGARSPLGRVAHTSVQRHDVRRIRDLRGFLRDLMDGWGHSGITENLELLASEVVTNALIHAHSDVDVLLREYPGRLRVEVRDNDPHPPVPAPVLDLEEAGAEEAESGRGLIIVEAVADAWGSSPAGRGKSTWFELTTTGS